MTRPPYNDARRVFWIVDNCSTHRGTRAVQRLQSAYPQLVLVNPPIHASWLNQVEIYFSIIQRKVLTPNDFADLEALRLRLALYEELSNRSPKPFAWKFDRAKMVALMTRIEAHRKVLVAAQPHDTQGQIPQP